MPDSLLATKLYIPPTRSNAISRPSLTEKLLCGLDRPGSFALLSGPAGFGKTTLLSDFVTCLGRHVAWVSLDEGDNDYPRFWKYLIAACQSVLDGVGTSVLELLEAPQTLPAETVPTMLINDLVVRNGSVVLVLDDYHEIQAPAIHGSLQYLLEHLPDNLFVVISTRIDPPWQLARFRARNQLVEIRASDLRFRSEEAAQFLNRTMGLHLSADDITALEERTEGWVAGLQLAALSMQGRDDISSFVKAFTGSQVYVAEYLIEEVLQRQPKAVQTFLLRSSLLKQMSPGLCEAVTGFQDGQAILQSLHRENSFVIPLDQEGMWFRYHHLFADLLQARLRQSLPAEEIAALQLRAADWYERQGFLPEAVNYALAAKDFERAAEFVKQAAHTLMFTGQVNILQGWLEAIPEQSFRTYPQLVFYQFWIDILQNKADLSEDTLREKEETLKALPASPENDRLRGELMSVICRAIALSGRTSEGIRLAKEALAYLPVDDLASRARANSALASALDLEGQAEEAEPAYQDSYWQAIAAGDYRLAAHTLMAKGLIQIHYGHLREAAGTFQTIVDMNPADPNWGNSANQSKSRKVFLPAGQGYIGLGCVHLEWNELDTAETFLQQGMDLCRQGGLDGVFIARVRMSRLRQAKGDLTGALEEIQVPPQMQRADTFNLVTRQIQIALAEENVGLARRLAGPLVDMLGSDSASKPPVVFLEIIQSIVARVYLANGEIEKALQLVEELNVKAGPGGRLGRLIEVHLLRALAYQKLNEGGSILQVIEDLTHALELGKSQGHILLFLEAGPALVPLLKAIANRPSTPDGVREYARALLHAFEGIGISTRSRPTGVSDELIKQLTPREMEVLELLAMGDSNQDIADKLVITVRTVKKHTGNIYGKLNASSRIQAVARARDFGLLPDN